MLLDSINNDGQCKEKIVIDEVQKALSFLPKRPDYDMWLRIISAIANHFSDATALEILLSHWKDEKKNETAYKIKHRLKDVGLGTLFFTAKQFGYKMPYGISHNFSKTAVEGNYGRKIKANKKKYELHNVSNPRGSETHTIAYNRFVIDKNKLRSGIKNDIPATLNNYFRLIQANKYDLMTIIKKGHPVMLGDYRTKNNGYVIRNSESWKSSSIFAVDIDKYLTLHDAFEISLTKQCYFIYTTARHTSTNHRFRIVFDLESSIKDRSAMQKLIATAITIYNSDPLARDLARIWFGNRNAIFFHYDNTEGVFQEVKI